MVRLALLYDSHYQWEVFPSLFSTQPPPPAPNIKVDVLNVDVDCLIREVRVCYTEYLNGVSGTTQIYARAVLGQIVLIDIIILDKFRSVSVSELLDNQGLSEGNSVHGIRSLINAVTELVNERVSPNSENNKSRGEKVDKE